jgi:hypothetical protein
MSFPQTSHWTELSGRGVDPKQVVVCIVADGRKNINPRVLDCLASLGVYQEGKYYCSLLLYISGLIDILYFRCDEELGTRRTSSGSSVRVYLHYGTHT